MVIKLPIWKEMLKEKEIKYYIRWDSSCLKSKTYITIGAD